MPTYRLTIEYEGTRYSGWQEQRNAPTVAGAVKAAATRAGGRVLQLTGAGRTDAGVHALAQSAHLRLERPVDPFSFRVRMNSRLPRDIHVLGLVPAAEDFDARRDALLRSYLYQIARRRTALAGRWVWWVRRPLDVARLAEAARLFLGRRDFAAFTEQPASQKSTLVEIAGVEVVPEGGLVLLRFTASHFLWKMVRRLVGVLVRVGVGEWTHRHIVALLEGENSTAVLGAVAEATAPAGGLFLEKVLYPGDPPLGAPAAATPVTPGPDEMVGAESESLHPRRSPDPDEVREPVAKHAPAPRRRRRRS